MPPVDEFRVFLERILQELNRAGIPYMICGSVGSGAHGQFRSTNDVDLIIAPNKVQLENFIRSFGPDYYLDVHSAQDALSRSMFNLIDAHHGEKADFIFLKKQPFQQEEFRRRVLTKFLDLNVMVASPEDIILSKLLWGKKSDSERQLQDAFGVVTVQRDRLDKAYMRKWAKELGVEELLERILNEAEKAQ